MLRFTALVVLVATFAAQPATGQTINVPRQSAPVIVSPQALTPQNRATPRLRQQTPLERAETVVPAPQISPLTPVQRVQAVQQLTGATAALGQTIVLTPSDPVSESGASFQFLRPSGVYFIHGFVEFAGRTDNLPEGAIRMFLPNWPAGQVLVDCTVLGVNGATFDWTLNSDISGSAPVQNNHLLFVVATTYSGGTVRISLNPEDNEGQFPTPWAVSRCEFTRLL